MSVNPDMANRDDVARLAADLMDANARICEYERGDKMLLEMLGNPPTIAEGIARAQNRQPMNPNTKTTNDYFNELDAIVLAQHKHTVDDYITKVMELLERIYKAGEIAGMNKRKVSGLKLRKPIYDFEKRLKQLDAFEKRSKKSKFRAK